MQSDAQRPGAGRRRGCGLQQRFTFSNAARAGDHSSRQLSVSISIPTNHVSANTLANISATWNGASVQSPLMITPQGQPASIALSPASVSGSAGSFATVTMAAPSATDQIFQVSSSNPARCCKLGADSGRQNHRRSLGEYHASNHANTGNDFSLRRRRNTLSHFDAESAGCSNNDVTGRNCGRPQRRASDIEPGRPERATGSTGAHSLRPEPQ